MSYRRLGDMVKFISNKNTDGNATVLFGINIDKFFMPSVANIIGVDLKKYKVVKKHQFACNRMHVGRDERLPISMSTFDYDFIVSPAYDVFEVITSDVLPEYLMLWFRRKEFDRQCWFYTDADVRGGLHLDALKSIEIKVPSIEEQGQIVAQYQSIANKIKVNEQICEKLEATAQALYKYWFVYFEFPNEAGKPYKSSDGKMVWNEELGKEIPEGWELKSLEAITGLITDGKHGNSDDEFQSGYYFISAKDILKEMIDYSNARQITYKDFQETHKRTNLKTGDILITNSGTIGKIAYVFEDELNSKTTFQKSVAILKPIIDSQFFFQAIKNNIRELIELAGGSTQSNLLLSDLKTFKILVPINTVINDYSNKINLIIKKSYLLKKQNQKLTQLQSLLLSRLAVGEEEKRKIMV